MSATQNVFVYRMQPENNVQSQEPTPPLRWSNKSDNTEFYKAAQEYVGIQNPQPIETPKVYRPEGYENSLAHTNSENNRGLRGIMVNNTEQIPMPSLKELMLNEEYKALILEQRNNNRNNSDSSQVEEKTDAEIVEEERQEEIRYALDISDANMTRMYLNQKKSLDLIIPHIPPIPDHVMHDLYSEFQPNEWCPTVHLKDLNPKATIRPQKFLSQKNAHEWDKRIIFVEEPHKYYIDGNCGDWLSVTSLVGCFFPDFDSKSQAVKTFQTKSFKDTVHRKSNKYYGCTSPEDIMAKWTEMSNLGTLLHANIENYYNNEPYTVCEENKEPFKQFLDLFQDKDWASWEPFRTEWSIFDPETRICGQIDFCGMINRENGHVVLLDWKRCESITDCCFNRFQGKDPTTGYGVCCDLENCKWVKYSLQLNTYKYILEKNYGLYVKKMYLIQLHPTLKNKGAAVYKVGNMTRTVEDMMACRKLALQLKARRTDSSKN
jgi:hypothetical protein